MELVQKLVKVALWVAIAAFVASAVASLVEDALGLSDDPWWILHGCGWLLWGAGLVGAVTAKIVAAVRQVRCRFPTVLAIVAPLLGFFVLAFRVVTHLGPMGVV